MPQVAGGLIEPRHIRVSLPRRLRKMRFVLGTVNHVDHGQKVVSWTGPEGACGQVGYDWLILTVGSVNALLPIPGLADYAHRFRTVAEAMYLRDHIIRQLELASVATDPGERVGPSSFVVVGAGYNGTEAGSVRGAWRGFGDSALSHSCGARAGPGRGRGVLPRGGGGRRAWHIDAACGC
jgi:NADH dehydrogenase